jgi:hypothetical protein
LANNEFDVNILDNEPCNPHNVDEDDKAPSSDNEEESNEALVGTCVEGNESLLIHSPVEQNVDEDDEVTSSDNEE